MGHQRLKAPSARQKENLTVDFYWSSPPVLAWCCLLRGCHPHQSRARGQQSEPGQQATHVTHNTYASHLPKRKQNISPYVPSSNIQGWGHRMCNKMTDPLGSISGHPPTPLLDPLLILEERHSIRTSDMLHTDWPLGLERWTVHL